MVRRLSGLSGQAMCAILAVWGCSPVAAQSGDAPRAKPQVLRLNAIPGELVVRNRAEAVEVKDGESLRLAARGGTNLFISPGGNYTVVDAPMALFEPDRDFTLTAKVSAVLRNIYDVAALVLYQDDRWWAKLCFENSVNREPTIVSVVTREYSDDCNSATVDTPYVYLGMAKKGQELSLHYSRDGKTWRLVRHFQVGFKEGVKAGFAVHGSRGDGFSATFSEITYTPAGLRNMRQMEAAAAVAAR